MAEGSNQLAGSGTEGRTGGRLTMGQGAMGGASGGGGRTRLVMPGAAARPAESDTEVVAGVRSLFGGKDGDSAAVGGDVAGLEELTGGVGRASGGRREGAKPVLGGYREGQVRDEEGVPLGREGTPMAGRPLPPTGMFHKPDPDAGIGAEGGGGEPPMGGGEGGLEWDDEEEDESIPLSMRLRAWWAGLGAGVKAGAGVAVLFVLVAAAAVGSVRCSGPAEAPAEKAEDIEKSEEADDYAVSEPVVEEEGGEGAKVSYETVRQVMENKEVVAETTPPAQPPAAAALPEWKVPGTKVTTADGAWTVTFEVPMFESLAYISKPGMAIFRALAVKLKGLDGGTVLVTGYTDNVPMSKPTKDFQSNADVAAARAAVAADHLKSFAKNSKLTFQTAAGAEADAPWPNDTPEHRRMNRTVVVKVTPGKP